jgi:N-methylhydantoinase A
LKRRRHIHHADFAEPVYAAIYRRASMPVGLTFMGPAIVEQDDTTTLVEPSWHCVVLADGALLLTRQGDA